MYMGEISKYGGADMYMIPVLCVNFYLFCFVLSIFIFVLVGVSSVWNIDGGIRDRASQQMIDGEGRV